MVLSGIEGKFLLNSVHPLPSEFNMTGKSTAGEKTMLKIAEKNGIISEKLRCVKNNC